MINFYEEDKIQKMIDDIDDIACRLEPSGYQDDESPEENLCDQLMRLNGSVRAVAFYLAELIKMQKGEDENGEDR